MKRRLNATGRGIDAAYHLWAIFGKGVRDVALEDKLQTEVILGSTPPCSLMLRLAVPNNLAGEARSSIAKFVARSSSPPGTDHSLC